MATDDARTPIRLADYGAIHGGWTAHEVVRFALGVAAHFAQNGATLDNEQRTDLASQVSEWLHAVKGGCGDMARSPGTPRPYQCTLHAFHDGDHEDVSGHASWPRKL